MKKLIIFCITIIGVVALNATTPQYRPFEDNDMPGKLNTEYQMYQRSQKKAIRVNNQYHTPRINNSYKNQSSYITTNNPNNINTPKTTISQQNVQYYNYRGEISETSRVEYNEHIAIEMRKGNTINSMPNTPFVETGDIQSVGYDSNPNEGWGEQVKDEEDDNTSDGPIGDAILPFLLFLLLYTAIRRKI